MNEQIVNKQIKNIPKKQLTKCRIHTNIHAIVMTIRVSENRTHILFVG